MQTWKKRRKSLLQSGMKIKGKWHGRKYHIKQKIGQGAIGEVYLVIVNGKKAALKMSMQTASIMKEVNALKALPKVQYTKIGPSLLDVDDWVSKNGDVYCFYVMDYIQGVPLNDFLKGRDYTWYRVLLLQLLEHLHELHVAGFVFGDLKIANVLVENNPPQVSLVDVGGVTKQGRQIKEYTEFYDRGYWGLGSRRAEPSYDLFSLVMIFIHLRYPNQFKKDKNNERQLLAKIHQSSVLQPLQPVFKKAIRGKYQTCVDMREDVLIYEQKNNQRKRVQHKKNSKSRLLEIIMISIVSFIYYMTSYFL